MYKIDKDIPAPENLTKNELRFPFSDMKEVGDSFFVPEKDLQYARKPLRLIKTASTRWSKKVGEPIQFEVKHDRTEDDNGNIILGFRVWRVK